MHPIFVRLGVFLPFLRKKLENAPKFCALDALKKKNYKKKKNSDRPKYSEIPLEGNTAIFFF